MSWTVDFGAWPQKWEELPEQIAVTNKETGEWNAYMLTSKAMRMIRDAKDDASWLHSELHGAELEAEKARDEAAENKWARELLNRVAESIRLANASSLKDYVAKLEVENTRLRSCLEDAAENERLTTHEFNQLEEERDKLRELVQITGYYCVNGYCEPGDGCPLLVDGRCTLSDRMKEMGVEI